MLGNHTDSQTQALKDIVVATKGKANSVEENRLLALLKTGGRHVSASDTTGKKRTNRLTSSKLACVLCGDAEP